MQIASSFSTLLGERFDGFIELSILEHWYNVVRGLEQWSTTGYFYPHKDGLGYNDGFFLFGLVFAGFRALGVDPFLSSELVNVAMRIVAFASMEALLRRRVAGGGWALFGAALFTIACNTSMRANHPQLLTVGLVPLFALLVWEAARAFARADRTAAVLLGCSAALLVGAWLLTAYYMAWFTVFYAAVYGAGACVTRPRQSLAVLRSLRLGDGLVLAAPVLVLAIAVTPFLAAYLPKARETGMHPWQVTVPYLTDVLDPLFIGDDNLIWSGVNRWLRSTLRPGEPAYSEHTTGFTPLLLLLFLYGSVKLWTWRGAAVRPLRLAVAASLAVWCLTLRVGDDSAWSYVHEWVPGARGLRIVVRYQLWLTAPVAIVATYTLSRIGRGWRTPGLRVLVAVGAGLLLLEQLVTAAPAALDRTTEIAWLRAIPPPPAACRAFFVSHARPGVWQAPEVNALYSHNVDAMLLSEWFVLPTINGYSTFNPRDWDFAEPDRPDYRSRVSAYAAAHRVDGLCGLDLVTDTWATATAP